MRTHCQASGEGVKDPANGHVTGQNEYAAEVPPVAVPLPMLDPEPSVVPGVGAS